MDRFTWKVSANSHLGKGVVQAALCHCFLWTAENGHHAKNKLPLYVCNTFPEVAVLSLSLAGIHVQCATSHLMITTLLPSFSVSNKDFQSSF